MEEKLERMINYNTNRVDIIDTNRVDIIDNSVMVGYDTSNRVYDKYGQYRMPPLIEIVEPTPPLCRNTPLFGLTGANIILSVFLALNISNQRRIDHLHNIKPYDIEVQIIEFLRIKM